MYRDKTRVEDVTERLDKDIPIPRKWKEHMLEEFKKQVNLLEHFSEIETVVYAWRWVLNPKHIFWETINYLNVYRAVSAFTITLNYTFDEGLDDERYDDKWQRKKQMQFLRVLQKLHYCGILTAVTLKPEEIGPGRHVPTIFLSPWAKDADFQKIKEFYINMGGAPGTKPKKASKTAKELSDHNQEMKVYSALKKYETGKQLYDFYKCPKKHPEALDRQRKPGKKTREALKKYHCPNCKKELQKISFNEFIRIKEKALLEHYNLK